MTLWSCCSSSKLSVECASICCRIAVAIGATKLTGFRSKSSQTDSANCSGVINVSVTKENLTQRKILSLKLHAITIFMATVKIYLSIFNKDYNNTVNTFLS